MKPAHYFYNYLKNLPKSSIIVLGFLLLLLIITLDYLVNPCIQLSFFYLFPITITTWFVNTKTGLLFSIFSSIAWFFTDSLLSYNVYFLSPYWNTFVLLGFFLIITYLLSVLKASYEREKLLARTDELTGAVNRRYFFELLEIEKNRSLRYQSPFTLAYLDVDNFKKINDRFGHKIGDRLLKSIAQNIGMQIRSTDILARLGGDEFSLLLPEANYESAKVVLERVQRKFSDEIESLSISVSMGAISFLQLPDTVEEIVERADRLMYEVKKSGKNGLRHEIFQKIESRQI